MSKAILIFLALAGAASCSSSSGSDGAAAATMSPIVFTMNAMVPANGELYQCQLVRLPSTPGDIFVGGGAYETSVGTHHLLLFRTSLTTPGPMPLDTPIDCFEGDGVMKYERGYVSGGQLPKETADFPAGLALPFHGGDILLMQAHFLNAGPRDVTSNVRVELHPVAAASVTSHVGTFRFYDPYIYVAPRSTATASMRCHLHDDVTLITAGSHMHKRGVEYKAFADKSGEPTATEPFYTTTDWQHPPYFKGPLTLPKGSDIRFECHYRNDSDSTFIQGLSAETNEMCMFSAFYAPAKDDDEDNCVTMDAHGTGAASCAQTSSCLELCPAGDRPDFSQGSAAVGPCWQQCIAVSCPNVTETLFPQLTCMNDKCKAECASAGAACTACAISQCKSEVDACQARSCSN